MKRQRTSRIGIMLASGLCVLAVYFIGFLHGKGRYVLYTAHFRVVDSKSKEPIEPLFTSSDRMDIWPKGDNSSGITVTLPDGTHSISWFGRRSSSPVLLPLYADGHVDGFVELHIHNKGFYSIPNAQVDIIELEPESPNKNQAPNKPHHPTTRSRSVHMFYRNYNLI
jgi:hypothetical protein